MNTHAQNPSAVLDGKPAFSLSSLAFRLLASNRLALAAWLALFLLAGYMDETDYRLTHPVQASTSQAAKAAAPGAGV